MRLSSHLSSSTRFERRYGGALDNEVGKAAFILRRSDGLQAAKAAQRYQHHSRESLQAHVDTDGTHQGCRAGARSGSDGLAIRRHGSSLRRLGQVSNGSGFDAAVRTDLMSGTFIGSEKRNTLVPEPWKATESRYLRLRVA